MTGATSDQRVPRSSAVRRRRSVALAFAIIGGVLVVVATVMIWAARLSLGKNSYVSGLGATGEVTAPVFNAALLMVAIGGLSIAGALQRVLPSREPGQRRTRVGLLLVPWLLVGLSSLCFLVASRVTCTYECPIPSNPLFTLQDAVHISFAVLGFALACLAMIGSALGSRLRAVRRLSWFAGSAVAVIAGLGGLLSLAEVGQQVGSWLEFAAMTIALFWLVGYGLAEVLAVGRADDDGRPGSTVEDARQVDAASSARG